ncbi:MAG: hypothetical protein ACLFTV_08265 [Desulfococcaceae bacterium]
MSARLVLLIVLPAFAGGISFAIRRLLASPTGERATEKKAETSKILPRLEAVAGSLSTFELYCLGLAGLGLLLGVAKGVFYLVV